MLSCAVCWRTALAGGVVSCFAAVLGWGWLAVFAVVFLLPVGIGTFGPWAVFSFPCRSLVVLLVTTGFRHDRSRYSVFVYFCFLYLSLKHLLRLVQCVRPHSPRASSRCSTLWFLSMRTDACWVDGLNAASSSWKALSYMIPLTLWICVSSGPG